MKQLKEEEVDIKKIISDLGSIDWGKDNDTQFKATQLLKGLAVSNDPLSNEFMKRLSDASKEIAKEVIKESVSVFEEKAISWLD